MSLFLCIVWKKHSINNFTSLYVASSFPSTTYCRDNFLSISEPPFEKTILSLLGDLDTLWEDESSTNSWVHLWTGSFIGFPWLPCQCWSCSLLLNYASCESSHFAFFLFQDCFSCSESLHFCMNFRISLSTSAWKRKFFLYFDMDSIEPIDQYWEYCHVNDIKFSTMNTSCVSVYLGLIYFNDVL